MFIIQTTSASYPDSKCRTPPDALVLNTMARTLIITAKGNEKKFDGEHIEVVSCENDTDGFLDLKRVLELLSRRGVSQLLVEGGGTVIWHFLKDKVVDDFYSYIGPCVIGGTTSPTVADGEGIRSEENVISLKMLK